ncbi:MAG: DUF2589 domain-containing protein [Planctomycetota bacterium]
MPENSALSLSQLIGAPLHALIDAEAQAALTTRRFIEEVGFKRREPAEDSTLPVVASEEDEFGDLRVAKFRQERTGADGNPETVEVSVPVLALLPIPALQVKDAELDFFIKIVDTTTTKGTVNPEANAAGSGQPTAEEATPPGAPKLMDFKAAMGRDPSTSKGQRRMETQIKMKINLQQADLPSGLAKMLNVLDEGISSRRQE